MRLAPLLVAASLALAGCQEGNASASTVIAPAAARQAEEAGGLKTAIFAGGCFWGVEAVFSHVNGVKSAVSGYHGGSASTATYERTNRGDTGHAEAVRIVYDPSVVRYDELLQVLFSVVADPTLRNRQGPDIGSQYRAAIVPLSAEQRAVAVSYLAQMQKSGRWERPIVTRVEPYRAFYKAEKYHQDFADRNPRHPYILRWDRPKIAALQRHFPSLYRSEFRRN